MVQPGKIPPDPPEPGSEAGVGPITRVVGPDDVGTRLDVFVARQPELGSRVGAKQLVRSGLVQVNGTRGKPGQTLRPGPTPAKTR